MGGKVRKTENYQLAETLKDHSRDLLLLSATPHQGNKGRALGFLMAIFQKIAASSFAAVRRTLKRRLLMLTLHEAFLRDQDLDIEGRERVWSGWSGSCPPQSRILGSGWSRSTTKPTTW